MKSNIEGGEIRGKVTDRNYKRKCLTDAEMK